MVDGPVHKCNARVAARFERHGKTVERLRGHKLSGARLRDSWTAQTNFFEPARLSVKFALPIRDLLFLLVFGQRR